MKEQRLKELEEAHKETMKSMAADYDNFAEIEKQKLTTYDEQVETQRVKVEEAMAKLTKEMKENFIEFDTKPSPTPVATASHAVAAPAAALTADMLTPEVVAEHMVQDQANLAGLTQVQGERIMASMFSLFQNLSMKMAAAQQQQQPTPQPPQQ